MCAMKDPRDLVFDAETQLWKVHAVVTLVSEVCHTAMMGGQKEFKLWTDHDEPISSDGPSVFANALEGAVEGLERLYLLLDELAALLREEGCHASDRSGDGEQPVKGAPARKRRKEAPHGDT